MDTRDRIEQMIKEYFIREYGNENALPGPVLNGIVDEICKHRWEIHSRVDEEYDLEDIDRAAEDKDIELTDEERGTVLHRYNKLEDDRVSYLYDIIDEIVKEREIRKTLSSFSSRE